MPLVFAEEFGEGDPQKGASAVLTLFAYAWAALKPESWVDVADFSEETAELAAEAEPSQPTTPISDQVAFAWGFGVTCYIDTPTLLSDLAMTVSELFSRDMTAEDREKITALILAAVFDRHVEFGHVLAPRASRVIVDTFLDAVKTVVATVEKKIHEITGETYTVERRRNVSTQIETAFKARYPRPPLFNFTGMLGGATASVVLPEATQEQLAAYEPLTRRLAPLWKQVTTCRRDYPETWREEIWQLPEVKRLKATELQAMKTVLDRITHAKSTLKSGAKIRAATCAREHARVLLGIHERSDQKLLEIEAESKRLNHPAKPD